MVKNKTWVCAVWYREPTEGTAYITATTEDEARVKAARLFAGRDDLEIVDITESPVSQLEMDLRYQQMEEAMSQIEANITGSHIDKGDLN